MKPIIPFTPYTIQQEWGTETVTAHTADYMTKVLRYKAGKAGGLQAHNVKDETFAMLEGRAIVESDDGTGILIRQEMTPGMAFHIPPGAAHRFIALEDCLIVEGSTPIENDRRRLEDVYGVQVLGDTEGLPSTW